MPIKIHLTCRFWGINKILNKALNNKNKGLFVLKKEIITLMEFFLNLFFVNVQFVKISRCQGLGIKRK